MAPRGRGITGQLGDYALSIFSVLEEKKLIDLGQDPGTLFSDDSLNGFFGLGRPLWRKMRERLQHFIPARNIHFSARRREVSGNEGFFHQQRDVVMQLPAKIGNYTDFYALHIITRTTSARMLRGPEKRADAEGGNGGCQLRITAVPARCG